MCFRQFWRASYLCLPFLLVGCVSHDWSYNPRATAEPLDQKLTISVQIFTDDRPPFESDGTEFIKFAPGVPFYYNTITHPELVHSDGHRSDASQGSGSGEEGLKHGMDLCNLLASALHEELKCSEVGSQVHFVDKVENAPLSDIYLLGRRST